MSIEDQVKKVIAESIGVKEDEILLAHRFDEHLGCDSLDMVELVIELENSFNIEIADEKIDQLIFVHQAIDLVKLLTCQNVAQSAPLATCGDNA